MNKVLSTLLAIILVLAIAGGSFYGGMVYGKSQPQADLTGRRTTVQTGAVGIPDLAAGIQGQGGAFAPRSQRVNGQGGALIGTIKEINDAGLVLADSTGKETQVKVTDTTLIEKNASVKLADLAAGETLVVSGSTAADGTVTARSVQVAPEGRFGMIGAPDGRQGAAGGPVPELMPGQ